MAKIKVDCEILCVCACEKKEEIKTNVNFIFRLLLVHVRRTLRKVNKKEFSFFLVDTPVLWVITIITIFLSVCLYLRDAEDNQDDDDDQNDVQTATVNTATQANASKR